jgi:pimeloyl-ACP methyl ester carboxylesterase
VTPLVLVHGGGFDSRCWERVLPHLPGPVVAVDLPGRGRRPARFSGLSLATFSRAIVDDIDEAGFEEVVLVGHSFAGASVPGAMARLGERVRQVVFIAAAIPEHGASCASELPAEVVAELEASLGTEAPVTDRARARYGFGNDLDDDLFEWCFERMVPEALQLTLEPVDLTGLVSATPRSWIRTLQDLVNPPDKQAATAARIGADPIFDLDAGHMCMIGQPDRLAARLVEIAAG